MSVWRRWIFWGAWLGPLVASCRATPRDATASSVPPQVRRAIPALAAETAATTASVTAPISAAPSPVASASAAPSVSEPPPDVDRSGHCPGTAVATCLARYSRPSLSPLDVHNILEGARYACFAHETPRELREMGACLPVSLGVERRSGQTLEVVYLCTDDCPHDGEIVVRYAGVAKNACQDLGGHVVRDPNWGGYWGCSPEELGKHAR